MYEINLIYFLLPVPVFFQTIILANGHIVFEHLRTFYIIDSVQ